MAKKEVVGVSNSSSQVSTTSTTPSNVVDDEYFGPGSIVKVTTCSHHVVTGEVVAYDNASKTIVLKTSSSNRVASLNDVHVVNVSKCSEVSLIAEAKANGTSKTLEALKQLNVSRLTQRKQTNLARKSKLMKAFKAGVDPRGQALFQMISKTLEDIEWDEDNNIVVMHEVRIKPPYHSNDVKAPSNSKAVHHVRKIVEKFNSNGNNANNNGSSNSKSSVPSSNQSGD